MTARSPDDLLEEAARIFATDPDRACDLRRQVTAMPVCRQWSDAHMDLAWYEAGMGNLKQASHHAEAVLKADPQLVNPAALAVAGVLANNFRDALGEPADEPLLEASIKNCIAEGQVYYAALGLGHVAHIRLSKGDRAAARTALEASAALYDQIDSEAGSPRALLRLADIAIEDGETEAAVAYIDRALARLEKFPFRGRSSRMLEDKLRKLRATVLG